MIDNSKAKNISFVLKLILSFVLIYFLFTKVEWTQTLQILKNINIVYFFLCLLVVLVSIVINTKKWQILLFHLNIKKSVAKLFELNLASLFYTMVLPGGQLAGETIKCYQITRDSREKGKLIFSVLLDRITGFIGLIVVGGLGILLSEQTFEHRGNIVLIFAILSFFGISFFFFFNTRVLDYCSRLITKVLKGREENILGRIINRFMGLFSLYKGSYKLLGLTVAYGIFYQILNSLHVYLLAQSIGIDISIFDVQWIMALVSIILLVPITVMGLGLREGGFVVFLSMIGVATVESLSLSMLVSLVFALTAVAGGVVELRKHLYLKTVSQKTNINN